MKHFTEFKFFNDFKVIRKAKTKHKKGLNYINIPFSLDIETTSTYVNGEKVSNMYIWGFAISNKEVYYGRTWNELKEFLEILKAEFNIGMGEHQNRMVIYVHNLAYEFQFMRKYFNWDNTFSLSERKPIKALTTDGIEFKCSYLLSGYSLSKVAEHLRTVKMEKLGDFDYKLIRHHNTPLTPQELKYLEYDCLIVTNYILEEIEQYTNIIKIPLTNTGRVRNYVRKQCFKTGNYRKYKRIMSNLKINDSQEYGLLKCAFQGGYTHANKDYMGKVLNNVSSIDFTSSYPAVMLSEKYPMSTGVRIPTPATKKEFDEIIRKYCVVFEIKLFDLKTKDNVPDSYLSESKCYDVINSVVNNGRIYSADELTTTITDVDFKIIRTAYDFSNYALANIIIYQKGYLPNPIIESILELYKGKTTLKGVEGKEVEYLNSKGMLNSIYGMCVTDIVKDVVLYDDVDEWNVETSDVDETIRIYNESEKRFLFYPWGVWVTAYARYNLWTGIFNINNDYIYADTDSIKLFNYEKHIPFINWYDETLKDKLLKMCMSYKINPAELYPMDKWIGVWDYEGTSDTFKTLGAKRYIGCKKGKYSITVAGLSKKQGLNHMLENGDIMEQFNNELYIPADKTGKMTHTYIDNPNGFYLTDYLGNTQWVDTLTGVHLENCEFTLSISKQYQKFIELYQKGFVPVITRI
ncbi:MAG: DNA polymerase [Cetobacterium sp.]